MFGKHKADNIELSRRHMLAVRLVDAINFAAPEAIPGFKPILSGFRLRITEEEYASWQPKRLKLYIEPAGYPKGSLISCFLIPKDGWYELGNGKFKIPHLGNFNIYGMDTGGGTDYQLMPPRMLSVTIRPERAQ